MLKYVTHAVILVLHVISAANSQLTVLTRPEALISSSGSTSHVVEGSVIQIYCTVEDDTTVTFTWTHNGEPLLNDPPHIRSYQTRQYSTTLSITAH